MGVLQRLLGRERRSAGTMPVAASDPNIAEFLGFARRGTSFASADEAIAMLGVAGRCVSLIAEGLAALPLAVYALDPDGGRREAREHPLWALLNASPNDRHSAFDFREALTRDLLIAGNGFAEIQRDGRGRVTGLEFMPARMVGVEQLRSGAIRYRYSDPLGATRILLADEVLHVRCASRDGILGIGPLGWAHGAAGLAVSQALLAASQAERGFVPDLAFETDQGFDDSEKQQAAFSRMKNQLTRRLTAMRNGTNPLLLEAGLKAKPLTTSGREAQFHEARLLGLEDIARSFGVPPSVLGLGRNASYGSLTQESQALVRDCLRPMASRIESALNLALLSSQGRRSYRIEHDLSDLTRGDLQSQMESYRTGIDASIISEEEARTWLGLSAKPRPGDTIRRPLNVNQGSQAPQDPPAV